MNAQTHGAQFTRAELFRAHQIRAFAERPEQLRLTDAPCGALHSGAFAGVVAIYRLRLTDDRRWRACTLSIPGRVVTPDRLRPILGLFGFRLGPNLTFVTDPSDPLAVGYAEPLGRERTCRVCGCTAARACLGGCWWVSVDVCSACREGGAR